MDQDQKIIDFNGGAERIFGYAADEVLGQPIDLLIPDRLAGAQSAHLCDFAVSNVPSLLMTGRGTILGLRKDGTAFPAEASISKSDFAGEPVFTAILMDRSEGWRTQEARHKSEENQSRLAQENAAIAEIGRIISSSLDINEVYDRFASEMRRLVDFDLVAVRLIDYTDWSFVVAFSSGIDMPQRRTGKRSLLKGTLTERALAARRAVLFEDQQDSTDAGSQVRFQAGLRSTIVAPLIAKDRVLGSFTVSSCQVAGYGEGELMLMELLANQLAPAIENAHLYQKALDAEAEQRRLAEENVTVAEISRIISSSLDINEVYERFARELAKLISFDRIVISTANLDAGEFTVAYHYGTQVFQRIVGTTHPLPGTHIWEAVTGRRTIFVKYTEDSTEPGDVSRFKAGLCCGVTVPLIVRGQALGTMSLQSCAPNAFDQHDQTILEWLANHIAPAIQNAQLYEEARRMGEELRQRAEALARSNAELEQFAYVASHDLQEPLRSISGFTQLLARHAQDNLDDEAHRLMDRITAATYRLQGLINDLLAYSRVGRNLTGVDEVDVESILSQAALSLEAAIQDAGATITHDPLPALTADATLMGQVLQNIIGNGIKFKGDASPHIHVSAREMAHEWIFSVQDNGIGISPQFSERIFAIFQRLHTRDEYPGSGIGLAICKKAVERMGGRIWVESQSGQGSTFYFTVPKVGPAAMETDSVSC